MSLRIPVFGDVMVQGWVVPTNSKYVRNHFPSGTASHPYDPNPHVQYSIFPLKDYISIKGSYCPIKYKRQLLISLSGFFSLLLLYIEFCNMYKTYTAVFKWYVTILAHYF